MNNIIKFSQLVSRFSGYVLLISCLVCGVLSADEISIITLSATYDFDKDGLSEFLSIEKAIPEARYPSSAAYYEIDEMGSHVELWRFTTISPIIDAEIIDTDGNGSPEIVVATKEGRLDDQTGGKPWLHLFKWTGVDFSPDATLQWSGTEDKKRYRLTNITIIDIDNDGRDEIAVALGSPRRELLLLRLDTSLDLPTFTEAQLLTASTISSGYGQIYLSAVDHNEDGYLDLMAINREHNSLKVQVFENEGGDFVEGPFSQHDLTGDLSGLIATGINTVDINQDGAGEVFLPFQSGVALALGIEAGELTVIPIADETASLFTFAETGLSQTDINEILLERAERGVVAMKARRLKLEAIGSTRDIEPAEEIEITPPTSRGRRVQRVELTAIDKEEPMEDAKEIAIPEQPIPEEPVQIDEIQPPISPGKKIQHVELTSLERDQEEQVTGAEEEPDLLTAAPPELKEAEPPPEAGTEVATEEELKTPGRVKKVELTSVTREDAVEMEAEPEIEPFEVSPDVVISDTIFVGQLFSHPLEQEDRTMHAFRPVTLPPGASFDPQSRAVTWTPEESHIGVHKLAYEVEYEITGERPTIEEVEGTSVQVLTKTESDTVELYILVKRPKE